MAYPSVVAGGTDSCTIHYLRNNKASPFFCPSHMLPVLPPDSAVNNNSSCAGLQPL